MPRRKIFRKAGKTQVKLCDHTGCDMFGEYPAPMKKHLPESFAMYRTSGEITEKYEIGDNISGEKYWFCLKHIREFNKRWDFFDGMNPDEIENFRMDAIYGHRLVWDSAKRTSGRNFGNIEQINNIAWKLRVGEDDFCSSNNNEPQYSENEVVALKILGVTAPVTKEKIKSQYRKLVKLYHPDKNKGDKTAEERIRSINQAYGYLKNLIQQ